MSKYEGIELKEATLLTSIHTVKSGTIKQTLRNTASGTDKATKMTLQGGIVELAVNTRNGGDELILVPISYFSHLVPISVK